MQHGNLTTDSLNLFLAYANDAGNWSGTPLVGGNIAQGHKENGHLTELKKQGLLRTFWLDGCSWVDFTEAGRQLAAAHGIKL